MHRRSLAPIALLLGLIAVVAACGPSASATSTPGAVATTLPTQSPPSLAPSDAAGASFALPSFVGDKELEAIFPDEIAGLPVSVVTMSGSEVPAGAGGAQLTAVLDALHMQPSDLSVAFGGAASVTINAFRVKGVPATQILPELVKVYQQDAPATTTQVSIGGKSVTQFTPTNPGDPVVYIYLSGDTVFTVGGPMATGAILAEVFEKLP